MYHATVDKIDKITPTGYSNRELIRRIKTRLKIRSVAHKTNFQNAQAEETTEL